MDKEFAVDITPEIIEIFKDEYGRPDYVEYINYIIECCKNNRNVYLVANGVKIYSADYYSFSEYFSMIYGITMEEKDALERLIDYNDSIDEEDKKELQELIIPVINRLKEIHNSKNNMQLSMKKTTEQ